MNRLDLNQSHTVNENLVDFRDIPIIQIKFQEKVKMEKKTNENNHRWFNTLELKW